MRDEYVKYLDEKLSDKERVKDLMSRMTIEEKASQLRYNAPAIKRLGIPAYNWWNEALHGVARAGAATVFPQAIGLAAMFDDEFVESIGEVVSTEGRAKYNEHVRKDDRNLYKGLTFWSPNINIFRDPRWGRGHETYGEDPYLTSRVAIGYIKGLQGKGNRLKSAACVKHFAAHSGPEIGRHSFNSVVSEKDLAETYYPAFEATIKEAKVEGVMGAYNLINGEPACGTPLINNLIRDKWGFDGYYVSDCGAIKDFHMHHMITSTATESAALALKNGCDLNCGNVYLQVLMAYQSGLVTEEDIDKALERVLMTRFRLGMFDSSTEYDDIPYEMNDTKEHRELALRAAEKSIVLLKNDGILPLDKSTLKRVAVIGPNADSKEILKGNYNGTATESYTILDAIRMELGEDVRVFYSEGCHIYKDSVEGLAEPDDRIMEAVSMAERSDIVFLCLGLDATLEGEEGDANNTYAGADKKDLELPDSQKRLMKAVVETGKPVIFLLSTGSAMNISYAHEHCSAVLQVWYPGQMGAVAASNLVFGKAVPSGRLPVTFYRTTEELPHFEDYSMKNRTYRYMENSALYPFGYGLSYGSFSYNNLKVDYDNIKDRDTIMVSFDITNTSSYDCEEVAQVYLKLKGNPLVVKNWSLVQFKRVYIPAGETVSLELPVKASAFQVVNEEGEREWVDVQAICYAGASQPDEVSCELTGQKPISIEFDVKK